MALMERDVLYRGIDENGNPTLDFPITRLANVEGSADIKAMVERGDYIPLMDTSDNGEMKMVSIRALLEAIDDARGVYVSQETWERLQMGRHVTAMDLAMELSRAERAQRFRQIVRSMEDTEVEVGTIRLTNTLVYPSNNSEKTVVLRRPRNNLDYQVVVDQSTDPRVGTILVYGKQVNGFKIRYEGDAPSATLKYYVSGGML